MPTRVLHTVYGLLVKSPALNAENWVQHQAADDDAYSHQVESIVVAVGDIEQPACTVWNNTHKP